MKISSLGMDLPLGKVKYQDEKLIKLADKFSPQKISPFFVEFVGDKFEESDCIVIVKDKLLDFLIMDMEKFETRINNTTDDKEKQLLQNCLRNLEKEVPICEISLTQPELGKIRELAPLSLKPTLTVIGEMNVQQIIEKALEKANLMFFYTAGPKEVKVWTAKKDSSAVECAGKIHSDIARGFIKAEIVSIDELLSVHNIHEAKEKGFVRIVDKDYIVKNGDVLNIRFNV